MEEWRQVDGFNNTYEVANTGKVRSKDHWMRGNADNLVLKKGRVLKTQVCAKGYERVSLSFDTKRFNTSVHRLMALSFIPNPSNLPQVNHINGNKLDNSIPNLEWVTNQENQIHAVKNKLSKHNYNDKHHMSKLTNEDVLRARSLFKNDKYRNIELATMFGVSQTAMSNILRNKTYKSINTLK